MTLPCSCARLMTPGSAEGSSRKAVKSSGIPSRAAWTGGSRWGRAARHSFQYRRVLVRIGERAGQVPESMWGRSPLGEVQGGRRQAPGSPVQ